MYKCSVLALMPFTIPKISSEQLPQRIITINAISCTLSWFLTVTQNITVQRHTEQP